MMMSSRTVGSVNNTQATVRPFGPPWYEDAFFLSPTYSMKPEIDTGDLLELNPHIQPTTTCLRWLNNNGTFYTHNEAGDDIFSARYVADDGTLCDIIGQHVTGECFDDNGHRLILRIRTPRNGTIPQGLFDALRKDDYTPIDASSSWTEYVRDLF